MRERFKEKEIAKIKKYLIKLGFELEHEFEFVEEDDSLIERMSSFSMKNPEIDGCFEITILEQDSDIYVNWRKNKENCRIQKQFRITHDLNKTKKIIKKEVKEWRNILEKKK